MAAESLWDMCKKDEPLLKKRIENSDERANINAIKKIKEAMAETNDNGYGLAANQIGINARACYIKIPAQGDMPPFEIEFHNPSIISDRFMSKNAKIANQEWCFSLDKNDCYIVERYHRIKVQDDKNGITPLVGIAAYAAQHEIDHLNGKLISDVGKRRDVLLREAKKLISNTPKNAQCTCGSGKKFKRCCGK